MTSSYVVTRVGNELTNAVRIREMLESYDDPQLIQDSIEGETELHEALCVVLELVGDEEMMLAGIDTKLAELQRRQSRIKSSIEGLRGLIARTMDRAGIKTIKSPLATMTLGNTPRHPIVTDESRLPPAAFEQPAPRLSMTRLRALMEAEAVPGAEWRNGAPKLTIRRA